MKKFEIEENSTALKEYLVNIMRANSDKYYNEDLFNILNNPELKDCDLELGIVRNILKYYNKTLLIEFKELE